MIKKDFFWEGLGLRLMVQQISHLSEINTSQPILVFLHDALGSIAQWKDFPVLLAEKIGLDAVIYERQGHGESSPFIQKRDNNYLHQEALQILPRLLEDLKIKQPILIGHSDGGSIALIYAGHYQPFALITIAAHIIVEDITLNGIQQALFQANLIKSKLAKYHGKEKTETLFSAWADTWLRGDFRSWNILSDISSIQCPVLGIQGTLDEYGSKQQIDGIKSVLGGRFTEFWVPKEGHAPHLKSTQVVIDKILIFINRCLKNKNL